MKKLYKIIYFIYWSFTKEGLARQRVQIIQSKCNHEEWFCDSSK